MRHRGKRINIKFARLIILLLIFILIFANLVYRSLARYNTLWDLNKYDSKKIHTSNNAFYIQDKNFIINLTIDAKLQKMAYDLFGLFNVPYGSFIVIEPRSGAVKALVHYSKHYKTDYRDIFNRFNLKADYVAASLTKLIVVTRALEERIISPTTIFYCGRNISVSWAIATSNNCVFEKVTNLIGKEKFKSELLDFGLNKTIPFDLKLENSKASIDNINGLSLGEVGSGFGDIIKISPIHAALIISAFMNDGIIMRPYIIRNVVNKKGRVLFAQNSYQLFKPTTKIISKEVLKMMDGTVNKIGGTAYRGFYDHRGNSIIGKFKVVGKTGSLNGRNPDGYYTWFLGALLDHTPPFAIATLVINEPSWKIRAASFTGLLLSKYLKK